MRHAIRVTAACAAIASCIFAALPNHAAAAEKRVALLLGPTQDVYIGGWDRAYLQAASKLDLKVTVFESPRDAALQAQQIDDAIAQKFDIIVVQTLGQKAIIPPLTRAKAAAVPVITIIAPLAGKETADLYTSYAGYNQPEIGALAGQAMGKILKDAGRDTANVAIVAGAMAEGIAPMRADAFKAAIAKFPGIKVVALEEAMWNPALAEKAAGQLIARFSAQGGLDGIYGMNDVMANGVIQATEAAGVKFGPEKGSIVVVGGNCMTVGVKNMQAGKEAASILLLPAEEAKLAATVTRDVLDGKKVEKDNYPPASIIMKADVAKVAEACSY